MTWPVMEVIVISGGAALVGFLHSLGPAHWMPVLFLSKSRKWTLVRALSAALVTGLAHVFATLILCYLIVGLEIILLPEDEMEYLAGWFMILFGLAWAAWGYYRHRDCSTHSHHGESPSEETRPFVFLFVIGFTPCFAALPSFMSGAPIGWGAVILISVAFTLGVLLALGIATILGQMGLQKLDHPVFEHWGDLIAGVGIALLGVGLIIFGEHHH